MNAHTKTWLNIYLEHARHCVHQSERSLEVVSHVWQVAWRENWKVLIAYLRQHIDVQILRTIDQWALNLCLLPHVVKARALRSRSPRPKYQGLVRNQSKRVAEGVDLRCANLNGADLCAANLMYADLRYANLIASEFVAADLVGANFRYANLRGADLMNTSLNHTDFRDANLVEVSFVGADLSNADLRHVDLKKADFQLAILRNADLRSANLKGANLMGSGFGGADLGNAKYNSQTQWPENFDPTDSTHGLIFIKD